ncbi:TetR/AcrR family transcriptional regulator [Saccharothrix sp. S26]|uniref:TetR/AcrR family transcriptional regulator n=1 Tax=Saccharothrix sp. S26 TaxID=2907215 RepID=UPI001F396E05|nr:TetR/AcrR family transcriptional regulator [Saccharothrix sp. S26]MCE7000765.1 TetR/AcrR family transcriptional regulator [Saccharothrix sp. S26]
MADGGRNAGVDGRAARWAGHREKRRAEIVTAALSAIVEHGPWASTEQIADRAGVSRPQLYRHFSDADDLYNAVAHQVAELFAAEIVPVLSRPSGSPREIISGVVGTFVAWMADNASLYDYMVVRAAGSAPGRRGQAADMRLQVAERLCALFTAYLDLLGADSRHADTLAFGVAGMVESATVRWLTVPGALDQEQLVRRLTSAVWALFDDVLREAGVELDPDVPLPELPDDPE